MSPGIVMQEESRSGMVIVDGRNSRVLLSQGPATARRAGGCLAWLSTEHKARQDRIVIRDMA